MHDVEYIFSPVVIMVTKLQAGRTGVRMPVRTENFLTSKYVHTGCGVHPDSTSMSTGGLSRC
jgi:hypothetical protein